MDNSQIAVIASSIVGLLAFVVFVVLAFAARVAIPVHDDSQTFRGPNGL